MITEVEILRNNMVVEVLPVIERDVVEAFTDPRPTIVEVITDGPPGTPGEPGPQGEGVQIDILATEDLPAYVFVTSTGQVADSSDFSHYNRVVGITTEAVLSGFIAALNVGGEVINGSWTWTPGAKLFLNGTSISNTPSSSGFSQMLAVAENAVSIIVKLEPPILL